MKFLTVIITLLIALFTVQNIIQEGRITALERSLEIQRTTTATLTSAVKTLAENQTMMVDAWRDRIPAPSAPAQKTGIRAQRIGFTFASEEVTQPVDPVIMIKVSDLFARSEMFGMFSTLYWLNGMQHEADICRGLANAYKSLIPPDLMPGAIPPSTF